MSWKDVGEGWVVWQRGRGGSGRRVAWGASVALALLCLAGCSTTGLPPDLASALETPGALAQATATATAPSTAPTKAPATATPTTTATTTPQVGDTPTATTTPAETPGAAGPTATATPSLAPTTPATHAPTLTSVPTASIPTTGKTADGCAITPAQAQAEAYVAKLLNQHRAAAGSAPLALDQTLSLASRMHSCDMYRHQQLSHIGSDGSSPGDRLIAVGLRLHAWGENIGDSRGGDALAGIAAIDRAMMEEPLTRGNHHWNIVNPVYTRVGIGVIIADGQVWFTTDFGG